MSLVRRLVRSIALLALFIVCVSLGALQSLTHCQEDPE